MALFNINSFYKKWLFEFPLLALKIKGNSILSTCMYEA